MKVTKRGSLFNYASALAYYLAKRDRSRTFTAGVKAVRLDKLGQTWSKLANTTLRVENDECIFRLYNTDIVRIAEGDIAQLKLDGWSSRTSFERIYGITGLSLFNLNSANKVQSTNQVRISASNRYGVPFVDGVKIDLRSGEVLPESVAQMQSDVRAPYRVPNKEAKKKFKEIFSDTETRMKMSIALGLWEARVRELNGSSWRIYMEVDPNGKRYHNPRELLTSLEQDADLKDADLYNLLRTVVPYNGLHDDVTKGLNDNMKKLRKSLLELYARDNNMQDSKGGQLRGEGYYVAGQPV